MKRGVLILLAALLLAAWQLNPAHAATAIVQLSSTIAIQADGSASINTDVMYNDGAPLNWTLYGGATGITVTDDDTGSSAKFSQKSVGQSLVITTSDSAGRWTIQYKSNNVLIRHDNRDQFYIKLFEYPASDIYNISADVSLPSTFTGNDFTGNIYTIGSVANSQTTLQGNNTLHFVGTYAGTNSIFTLNASWPHGGLPLSQWTEFKLSFMNLDVLPWLVLGILLPLVALFTLADLLWRRRRAEQPVTSISRKPPSDLSPMIVGVLVNKKIYTAEIAALIIDLCQRGYLVIVRKNATYNLGIRKQSDEHLLSWEKEIIDQLFQQGGLEVSREATKSLHDQALFSPKVMTAFNEIYDVITQLNIFRENPHYTRIKYKLFGLALYLISAIGLIWLTVTNANTYLLIPFAALIIIAFLINKLSPRLVQYSAEGYQKRADWLSFANFLKSEARFDWKANEQLLFEKYLAYSIALNCTQQWALRFDASNLAIVQPEWLITGAWGDNSSVQELTNEIMEFVTSLSAVLEKLRGPLVT